MQANGTVSQAPKVPEKTPYAATIQVLRAARDHMMTLADVTMFRDYTDHELLTAWREKTNQLIQMYEAAAYRIHEYEQRIREVPPVSDHKDLR